MAFETYRRVRTPPEPGPSLTIHRRGTLSLNLSAFRLLGEPRNVELLYDQATQLIGVRRIDMEQDSAHQVRPTAERGPFLITAMAFLRHYNIQMIGTRRWPAVLEGDVLCIDLNVPGLPVTSNRAGTGRRAST